MMTVSVTTDADVTPEVWNAYAQQAPTATLYHLHAWKQVIEETFGHRTIYLSALTDRSRVVGILPLVELKSWMFGNMLVSLPFFNYGGICADTSDARDALLAAAIRRATDGKADFIEIRHEDDWDNGLPRKTSKVAMRLELPFAPEELWKSFSSKLRNQVQRPRKEGMRAVVGQEEELDGFYRVFSANMRDLGTPVYPKSFFLNMLRRFPERTWISTVYAGNVPVASGFLAGFRGRLEIPWASAVKHYNRSSPNMLLYWTCLEWACSKGYGVFDFGRSTPGEGTYRFKEQWGARPHPLYWYYWLRNGGRVPQVNPKNPKYRGAIALWRHLPLSVTRAIGPRIVKYIP